MKWILIIIPVILLSCHKDEDIVLCPNEVKPHIESFKNEASYRGIKLKFKGLKIILIDKSQSQTPGSGGYYIEKEHSIFIDTSQVYYKTGYYASEAIVFHELGHAILKRPHVDDLLPNGEAKSLMNSLNYDYSGLSIYKRQYYIDELFNPLTPTPDWAN